MANAPQSPSWRPSLGAVGVSQLASEPAIGFFGTDLGLCSEKVSHWSTQQQLGSSF